MASLVATGVAGVGDEDAAADEPEVAEGLASAAETTAAERGENPLMATPDKMTAVIAVAPSATSVPMMRPIWNSLPHEHHLDRFLAQGRVEGALPDHMMHRVNGWSMVSARRGVASILGGTAAAQVIALAAAPLISRLFTASEYGPFAVISAASLPLVALMALRLDLAIPAIDGEATTLRVARFGTEVAVFLMLAFALLGWVVRIPLAEALKIPDARIIPTIPIIAGVTAIYTVLNQVAIRHRRYRAIGQRNLLQGAAVAGLQLVAGLVGWGSVGLAAGMAGGQFLGVVSLAYSLRDLEWIPLSGNRGYILREFRSYPLLMAPSGLVNALGLQAPVILASASYGHDVSGWLGMTQRILALPVGLIGSAISQVYLGEFGAARRNGRRDLSKIFLRTSKILLASAVIMTSLVLIFGPWAFAFVLGAEWRNSGIYAQALAIGMGAQMVAAPLSQTLIALGRVKQQVVWDVGRLLACGGAVLMCQALGVTAAAAMWSLGITTTLAYAASWVMSLWAVMGSRPKDRIQSD